jgi:hypothetical protein
MDFSNLFLQRYNPLYEFWLEGFWQTIPHDLMRQRPHPRLNSIAWIFWHLTRVEDSGLNRFITGREQVFDSGGWLPRLNIPWRHHGSGMTSAEVDELGERIDLDALRAYSQAVRARTLEIVARLDPDSLETVMDTAHMRRILFDEGLAHPAEAEGLLANYTGWTKGKVLLNFGLTHPYQHVGEVEVIATLLGVEFD